MRHSRIRSLMESLQEHTKAYLTLTQSDEGTATLVRDILGLAADLSRECMVDMNARVVTSCPDCRGAGVRLDLDTGCSYCKGTGEL